MESITPPQQNAQVHLFVQFDGDDEYSGPYTATVRGVDALIVDVWSNLGLLGRHAYFNRVPYGAGSPTYWLPITTSGAAQ